MNQEVMNLAQHLLADVDQFIRDRKLHWQAFKMRSIDIGQTPERPLQFVISERSNPQLIKQLDERSDFFKIENQDFGHFRAFSRFFLCC